MIKGCLKEFVVFLMFRVGGDVKVFVDIVLVMEKLLV